MKRSSKSNSKFGHRSPEYQEYIHSAEWRKKAAACKARAGHRCQVCNGTGNLDAHHRTYERFMDELDGDLTALCRKCHDLFHQDKPGPAKKKAKKKKVKKPKAEKTKKAPRAKKARPHPDAGRVEALNEKLRQNKLKKAAVEIAAIRNVERRKALLSQADDPR